MRFGLSSNTIITSNMSTDSSFDETLGGLKLIEEFDPEPEEETCWVDVVRGKESRSNVGNIMKVVARMGAARNHRSGVRPSSAPPRIVPGL